jgi:glycosyltransferase involved in cell wall biosynthesis
MNCVISAIIPAYNCASVIGRAIESIKNQTVGVFEIIIVDDGSSDSTADAVKLIKVENPDLLINFFKKENGGAASARNFGLRHATGAFIAFLDADDEWVPTKTADQLDLFNSDSELALVGGNYFESPIKSFFFKEFNLYNEISHRDLLWKNFFQTSTVMIRRQFLGEKNIFPESQRYAEEGNFFITIAYFNKCALLNKQVVVYDGGEKRGFGESGLSANIWGMESGELSNIRYAREVLGVSSIRCILASMFSLLKFSRRFLITYLG